MDKGLKYLLWFVAMVVVANLGLWNDGAVEAVCYNGSDSHSMVIEATNSERNYIEERNTRVALVPHSSYSFVPNSGRSVNLRHRTTAGGCGADGLAVVSQSDYSLLGCSLGANAELSAMFSRAVDYFIYALRHIII